MNRTQKKCLLVSTGLHVGLLSSVVLVSAFRPATPAPLELAPIDFVPVITTDEMMSGGGNPKAPPLAAAPPVVRPAPAPPAAAEAPPQPAPREPDRAPKAKPEEESLVPAARPTRQKPQIDPSAIVTRPGSEKSKAKQAESEAQEREQARAAAEGRRMLIGQLGQVANHLGANLSGVTAIQIAYGPGGGGLPYANFYQAVQSIYTREWMVPDGVTEKETTTVAEVTIARDGTVVQARIVRFSGNVAVDDSVQMTLDRVRRLVPLPANAEEDQRTVTINFNAKPESKRAPE